MYPVEFIINTVLNTKSESKNHPAILKWDAKARTVCSFFMEIDAITLPPSLHVPADAVIDSGTRTIVYVDTGNGAFEPRMVETGWRLGRQVEITGRVTEFKGNPQIVLTSSNQLKVVEGKK